VSELPSGTVTFLFTDIEGSTSLLGALGDEYAVLIADHRRIARTAAEAQGGHEVDTQGDSFFFAFARAKDAVRAALAMQLAFEAHEWPRGNRVRVRMGLHTGEPALDAERYIGLGVHRAARIGAAAHGGQVLLSNATRELLEDDPPEGTSARDLGTFRLKDFDRPERLFRLVAPGLDPDSRAPQAPLVEKPRRAPHGSRTRRRWLVGSTAAVAAGLALIAAFAIIGAGSGSVDIAPNSIIRIDPSRNDVVESIRVGRFPTGLVVTEDAIWVANEQDRTLTRIERESGDVSVVGGIAGATQLARDERGNVYVSSFDHPYVWRVDPERVQVVQRFHVRSRAVDLAVGGGFLWVLDRFANVVVRIDLAGRRANATVTVGSEPIDAAFGYGALWVANLGDASVSVLRLGLGRPDTVALSTGRLFAVAAGEGAVWVASNATSTVTRIDPDTRRAGKQSQRPQDVEVSAMSQWVPAQSGGPTGPQERSSASIRRRMQSSLGSGFRSSPVRSRWKATRCGSPWWRRAPNKSVTSSSVKRASSRGSAAASRRDRSGARFKYSALRR
jgi:class 3 adenylate cyclase/DNA-binding beta-propeller fold protein YncE